jgi:hypothetical protein
MGYGLWVTGYELDTDSTVVLLDSVVNIVHTMACCVIGSVIQIA